ncbi:MAG: DUF2530 domain-containing protein [Pseudonocardiaceae bacterium]|nr:DUF2530 domain-containing protein [Pseudonocardiaceae bacterium]
MPPPLPHGVVDTTRVVIGGSAIWFLLFCGLLVSILAFDSGSWLLLWTCAAGWGLGLVGLAVMHWQRSAARRGSRGAQTGL